jgi:hypothetical protein
MVRAWLAPIDRNKVYIELYEDSAPGRASLWPEHTHRATRPENPTTILASGHNGL